jgi:transposase
MSDDFERIEIIAGRERRRRWSGEAKLRIVEETLTSGDSVSAVARRHGVAPDLLYRWRRLVSEGGAVAVQADDGVTGNGEVRRLEERMRELERHPGLVSCFTPVASPESNGMSEAFVKTLERDYVRITPIPDAQSALDRVAGWFEDDNENHRHSGLRMRSPREFRRAL